MPLFYDNKQPGGCGADLILADELRRDGRPVFGRIRHPRDQSNRLSTRGWTLQLDCIARSDRAARAVPSIFLHQVKSGGPIGMSIEESTDDAPVQHSRKGFVKIFWRPIADDFIADGNAAESQPMGIRRAAAKANASGRVFFLKAFFRRGTHAITLDFQ